MTMNDFVIVLAASLISLSCMVTAGAMAWHARRGWGWFLFVGFLVAAACLPNPTYMPY